jgi:hypothetical protein
MTKTCGDGVKVTYPLFQEEEGGAIPTSPLQLFIKEINKLTSKNFYKKWHYLGDSSFISTINYGAYYDDRLVGSISYGSPNATEMKGYFDRNHQDGWWEIKRLAMIDSCPKNSESRFIAISIKILRKTFKVVGIVTLADSGVGHVGTIYQASGFKYLGLSDPKKDFFIDGNIQQRGKVKGVKGEWRDRSRKHKFVKVFNTI